MASMNQLKGIVRRCLRTRQNLKILSAPGQGKTTALLELRDEEVETDPNFFFLIRDGGTMSPTDTIMAMPDMENLTIQRLIDSGFPNGYTTPDLRGIIYIGEGPLMGTEVSKGMQKLWNHEDIGGFFIPHGVIFVTDGQRTTDKSGTQRFTRSNESRFVTYNLEWDAEYGLDVAKKAYHPIVAAFLDRNPALVDNYADIFETERAANDLALREGNAGAWASLRSWRKVSDILLDEEETGERVNAEDLQVRVGSGVGQSFSLFREMVDKLATLEEITKSPDKAKVPTRMDELYALSIMLALTVNKDSFKPVAVYMQRCPDELQTVFFKMMNDRLTKAKGADASAIRSTMEYKKWITSPHITKLLIGATQS